MRRIAAVIAGLSLLGLNARAADDKVEVTHKHGKVTRKAKAEHKMKKNIGGGTTETKEGKGETSAPGRKEAKGAKKETVKRGASGTATQREKKEETKEIKRRGRGGRGPAE